MKVRDVEVVVKVCDHCKNEPTGADVELAVRRAQEHRACPQFRCAYCGETIKATKYSIHHDSSGWSASEAEIEPALSINQISPQNAPSICHNNGLHLRCVERSMPFINGFDLQRRR